MPLSGRPISAADLEPYAAESREILEVPGSEILGLDGYPIERVIEGLEPVQFRITDAPRFADKYEEALARHERIWCFLHCNVVDMRLSEGLNRADHVVCAGL